MILNNVKLFEKNKPKYIPKFCLNFFFFSFFFKVCVTEIQLQEIKQRFEKHFFLKKITEKKQMLLHIRKYLIDQV